MMNRRGNLKALATAAALVSGSLTFSVQALAAEHHQGGRAAQLVRHHGDFRDGAQRHRAHGHR